MKSQAPWLTHNHSFGQLAAMVSEQSEMIQRIDANTYVFSQAPLSYGTVLTRLQRGGRGQRRRRAKRAASLLVARFGESMAHSENVWCSRE